jgi:hypothetical protein
VAIVVNAEPPALLPENQWLARRGLPLGQLAPFVRNLRTRQMPGSKERSVTLASEQLYLFDNLPK